VIAIIITIMVLELATPRGSDWTALADVRSTLLTYLLTFVFLGIYWSNHHHLVQTVKRVTGAILWANLHLLFWLSLTPFVTRWMGDEDFAATPVAAYGIVLLLAAIAYYILQTLIMSAHGPDFPLRVALGKDVKGKISPVFYAIAIPMAYISRWISIALYIVVAIMWLVPDRRIEALYEESGAASD
jgi:TMEM175 potassium channel family protein